MPRAESRSARAVKQRTISERSKDSPARSTTLEFGIVHENAPPPEGRGALDEGDRVQALERRREPPAVQEPFGLGGPGRNRETVVESQVLRKSPPNRRRAADRQPPPVVPESSESAERHRRRRNHPGIHGCRARVLPLFHAFRGSSERKQFVVNNRHDIPPRKRKIAPRRSSGKVEAALSPLAGPL